MAISGGSPLRWANSSMSSLGDFDFNSGAGTGTEGDVASGFGSSGSNSTLATIADATSVLPDPMCSTHVPPEHSTLSAFRRKPVWRTATSAAARRRSHCGS